MGGTQQCVVIPQSQYSKWKRIFSRQVVEASQIEVMETIGEGAVIIISVDVINFVIIIIINKILVVNNNYVLYNY